MRKRGRRINHTRRDDTAFVRVIADRRTMPADHLMTLGIAYHMALEAIRTGRATDTDMNQIALALNMAAALCERGICAEHLSRVEQAQEGLVRCQPYSLRVGRWVINGDAYRAICDALLIHDEQLRAATELDIREASAHVNEQAAIGNVIRLEETSHQAETRRAPREAGSSATKF